MMSRLWLALVALGAFAVVARGEEIAPAPRFAEPRPVATWGDARLRMPAGIAAIVFHPDGKRLATIAHFGEEIWLWDVASGKIAARLALPRLLRTDHTPTLDFSADGSRLFVQGFQIAAVFATDAGRLDCVFRPGNFRAGFSPDGRFAAGTADGQLTLWDATSGRVVRTLGKSSAPHVSFSPDGKQVAVLQLNGEVLVVPVDGSKPLRSVVAPPVMAPIVREVRWLPRNQLLVTRNDVIAIHDAETGAELARPDWIGGETWRYRTTFPGKDRLFARVAAKPFTAETAPATAEVVELDLKTFARKPATGLAIPYSLYPVAISADGKLLAVGEEHAVRLLDTATGKSLHPDLARIPAHTTLCAFTPDGGNVLTRETSGFVLRSVPGWEAKTVFSGWKGDTASGAFSRDGRWMAEVSPDAPHTITIHDARTGKLVFREAVQEESDEGKGGQKKAPGGRSPDRYIAGFDASSALWAFDPETGTGTRLDATGKTLGTVAGFPFTRAALMSPDGRQLAVSGQLVCAVRGTDPKAEWREIERHPRSEQARSWSDYPCPQPLAFSPDGRYLLTLNRDKAGARTVLTLYNVVGTPQVVGRWRAAKGEYAWTHYCRFTPDSRRILLPLSCKTPTDEEYHVAVLETATCGELFRFSRELIEGELLFTPNGQLLSASHVRTYSLWDWRDIERRWQPTVPGSMKKPEGVSASLSSADARTAANAITSLAADPKRGVAALERLFLPPDVKAVAALVAKLGDEDFTTRESATRELSAFGFAAERALRDALKQSPSQEARDRAKRLLAALTARDGCLPEIYLRAVRAVEALERIGSPEAKALLAKWATDHAGTVLTTEAKAALERLLAK